VQGFGHAQRSMVSKQKKVMLQQWRVISMQVHARTSTALSSPQTLHCHHHHGYCNCTLTLTLSKDKFINKKKKKKNQK
jgi:hypothetical protein